MKGKVKFLSNRDGIQRLWGESPMVHVKNVKIVEGEWSKSNRSGGGGKRRNYEVDPAGLWMPG